MAFHSRVLPSDTYYLTGVVTLNEVQWSFFLFVFFLQLPSIFQLIQKRYFFNYLQFAFDYVIAVNMVKLLSLEESKPLQNKKLGLST